MRVLVTGSAGFLGRAVAAELMASAFEVVPFDLRTGHDVRDPEQFRAALDTADAVVHLAAPSSMLLFGADRPESWAETVEPLAFLLRHFGGRVVVLSSGTVYGNCRRAVEDNPLPAPPNTYAAAKRECERLALMAAHRGVDVKVARVFTGYGPGEAHKTDYESPVWRFARDAVANRTIEVFGRGDQQRDFIYVDDVAAGLVGLLTTLSQEPIVNIATGTGTTFAEVLEMVEEYVGSALDVRHIPAPAGYPTTIVADTGRMEEQLAWRPTVPLREGIRRTIDDIEASLVPNARTDDRKHLLGRRRS